MERYLQRHQVHIAADFDRYLRNKFTRAIGLCLRSNLLVTPMLSANMPIKVRAPQENFPPSFRCFATLIWAVQMLRRGLSRSVSLSHMTLQILSILNTLIATRLRALERREVSSEVFAVKIELVFFFPLMWKENDRLT